MASLPPVVVGTTAVMWDSQSSKLSSPSLPLERRKYTTKELDRGFDSISLEFREAVSLISPGCSKLESSSYVPILRECMHRNSIAALESVHGHMVKSGFYQELFLMTFLVNAYAKCGAMGSARKVFDNLCNRNVVSWTSLMSGHVQNFQPELAIRVFKEMLEEGCYPTNYTLGIALNACTSLCDISFGKQIHGYIVKYNIEHDTSIGNALCSLYSKCRYLEMALKAFRLIEDKNVISWTAAVSACGENGNSATGLETFAQMLDEGVVPNEITLTSVFSLCCTMQAVDVGSQVHSLAIKLGYGSDLPIMSSIMYLYLKSGCIQEAKKLFDGMESVNLVTWNAMIAGHAEMTSLAEDGLKALIYGVEAFTMFHRMSRSGLKPDLYTLSSLLTVCSSVVALEQGEQVHAQSIKTGFLSEVVVGTALVNMYSKCGSIDKAGKGFVEMPTRTLISWTSMISALAQHGHAQQALHLFDDMRFVGIRPNKVTFVAVLSACSQAGIVEQALDYYNMMKNEYKIKPVMEHYACIVDTFVRSGRIEEAVNFIRKADFTPNEFIWSVLVSGSRSQEKMELAFYAADQLLELTPKDPETYFMLLNMYLSSGRWRDVSRVRKMMRDEKVDKVTDWSWISIRNQVHAFKPGSKKHVADDVGEVLDDLVKRAMDVGYRPELETDDWHSEKVAVAFGLVNGPAEGEIRVVKRIGMCRDCHSFMKYVSRVTKRRIVVRDSKRLHKFDDGECCCGDFGAG